MVAWTTHRGHFTVGATPPAVHLPKHRRGSDTEPSSRYLPRSLMWRWIKTLGTLVNPK